MGLNGIKKISRYCPFKERIMETEEVQHQLQKNLEATLQEIVDLDAHIDMLKVRICQYDEVIVSPYVLSYIASLRREI
jgi:hypothetical protein